MSARRFALGCALAGACTGIQPVLEDMPEVVAEDDDVPGDRSLHGRSLQLAAVTDSWVNLTVLADGMIAVHGPGVLALAPAGSGQLETKRAWLREWPQWPGTIGGRWPDDVFVTAQWALTRTGVEFAVWRHGWRGWVRWKVPLAPLRFDFYSDYAVGPDGAILGLRGFEGPGPGEDADVLRAMQAADPDLRTTIDVLDGGPPPPWPPLPPGREAVQLATFADGTLVVLRRESSLLRWSPGAGEWVELPALPKHAPGVNGGESAVMVGRDPARLYVHRCVEKDRPVLDRLTTGAWRPVALPGGGCVRSLAEAPDGTLWLVNDRGLYRRAPGSDSARWEEVPLAPVDAPGKPVATLDGTPVPPQGPEPVTPRQVLALDRGEVWVVAGLGSGDGESSRAVVLTNRTVLAPLVLRSAGGAQGG
ncbi:hypothetical protein [Nannocystis radixulma]|uniref:Lipoprotein n=1 Tax=Nannocystis radixulma TaxID=2995305 RepID=A0ABT5BQQ7_9BACT|nr:hypothetical protein [Nannocystis radixulma]MDC0675261.1 hypothetical protein [Nannocystis radixulma]